MSNLRRLLYVRSGRRRSRNGGMLPGAGKRLAVEQLEPRRLLSAMALHGNQPDDAELMGGRAPWSPDPAVDYAAGYESLVLSGDGPTELVSDYPASNATSGDGQKSSPNLWITDVLMVDVNNDPITAPVVGEMVFVRARWRTTDLTSADTYRVRFWLDGVPLDSGTITGRTGTNMGFYARLGGWYASPGQHQVRATVDDDNRVAEVNEADNTRSMLFTPSPPTTLPEKFLAPLGGIANQDWVITNYLDVDPRSGQTADYRDGPIQYDGHRGLDLGLRNFTEMDAGAPVYAAAAGVVSSVDDGHFDRETARSSNPANFVRIDHGNGWETLYYHLAMNTIAVQAGEVVEAGQILALVGSSGDSSGAHLHFGVKHNGAYVETFFDPDAYWADPLPYQGDRDSTVLDYGITNYTIWDDIKERASDVSVFSNSYNGPIWFWYRISHLKPGDSYKVKWYRPSGALHVSALRTAADWVTSLTYGWNMSRDWSPYPGTWQITLDVNGVELARADYQIGPSGVSALRVSQSETYIIDERTTPIDFGSAAQGAAVPLRTFTLENHGTATLTTGNLELPPGFFLVGGFPTVIPAGTEATFRVGLDTSRAGRNAGRIRFTSNDPAESLCNFNVTGLVVGSPPVGAPQITLPGPALAYSYSAPPEVLVPQATLTDSDSPDFDSGVLSVEFAAGEVADDRLGIRDQGGAALKIGLSGSTVTYGGVAIGGFSGGQGGTPLRVDLNQNATTAAVEALLRNVTYANVSPEPHLAPRQVRFTLTDGSGQVSNRPLKVVIQSPHPPRVETKVVDRHVFYNRSAFDGNDPAANRADDDAIATGKQALLPGQTATFANYTSYSRGINGVMVDIAGLPDGAALGVGDFLFKVGNHEDPAAWSEIESKNAPSVDLRAGHGVDDSDRVTIIFDDNVIRNQWLQVTVLANENTELARDDVFYYGNAVGESGNSAADARVNAIDVLLARNNPRNLASEAPLASRYDFDRDRRVNATDMLIARDNQTHFLNALKLITEPESLSVKTDWLYDFQLADTLKRPAKNDKSASEVVDKLFFIY